MLVTVLGEGSYRHLGAQGLLWKRVSPGGGGDSYPMRGMDPMPLNIHLKMASMVILGCVCLTKHRILPVHSSLSPTPLHGHPLWGHSPTSGPVQAPTPAAGPRQHQRDAHTLHPGPSRSRSAHVTMARTETPGPGLGRGTQGACVSGVTP